jgi:methylphosphotriester-DNA--protein-cysteine methyltransferase
MIEHQTISGNIFQLLRNKKITLAGNKVLKIYGSLQCSSGKRMLKRNRVFFRGETEALENGYRPCGNCMREQYEMRKNRVESAGMKR